MKDGGPAFGHGSENGHCCGMTMRQWYKGMIAGHLFSDHSLQKAALDISNTDVKEMAKSISNVIAVCAEAMIAEDKKHEEER